MSRGVVARAEQGRADRVTVVTLERIARPLGARLICRLDWNGEALDRLLDADHASIVEQVVRILTACGWLCATEVSFSVYGERGSIDILAFHPGERVLLVIEVKSTMPDVQATLVALDRKARLGMQIARERGWDASTAGRLLVIGDNRTARRRVAAHEATFAAALPDRSRVVRRWLVNPRRDSPLAGLWFLSRGTQEVAKQRIRRRKPLAERDPQSKS